jgi:hypothetical protein
VDYMMKMANLGYSKCKLGLLVPPSLSRVGIAYITGVEIAQARGLCLENVATFYQNFEQLYEQHHYSPDHIWNSDETGAQVGRSGGTRVFVR